MFRKSGSKAIGAVVMQTRSSPSLGAVSGLIWSDGATRDAAPTANAAGRIPGIAIEGKVSGDADISVNGRIKGDVDVTSLTVDAEGVIEGSVIADLVEVHGRVLGNIQAGVIKLHPQSFVQGDLTYAQLSIELGAEFQGACRQLPKPAPAEAVAVVPEAAGAPPLDSGQAAEFDAPAPPVAMHDVPADMQLQTAAKAELAAAAHADKGESLLN